MSSRWASPPSLEVCQCYFVADLDAEVVREADFDSAADLEIEFRREGDFDFAGVFLF